MSKYVSILMFTSILVLMVTATYLIAGIKDNTTKKQYPVITLEKKNTLAFRDVVTYSSVTTLQSKAFELSDKLPNTEPIYLFLDTPGGMITAGQDLITSLKALPQEVKTITNFSASMGYIMVQSLGERLLLPTGTLMMHRAKIGVQGQIPGEFNTQSDYWQKRIEGMETEVSTRMGLNLDEYQRLVKDEFWTDGNSALTKNAADKLVLVRCGSDLHGHYNEQVQTLFGPVYLTWSECPLITSPLSVDLKGLSNKYQYYEEVMQVKEIILTMAYDRKKFLRDSRL